MMPTIASVTIHPAQLRAAFGNIGRQKRNNPYVPIFNMTDASMTEPAVGASTCASGSQVCKGNSGTLMAKAIKNARKSQREAAAEPGTCPLEMALWISVQSNEPLLV